MCSIVITHIKDVCMKKTLLVFAATTALWAALTASLLYTHVLFVLTRADVIALEESFANIYARGYEAYQLYLKCRNST
jgi:hypothetical protein